MKNLLVRICATAAMVTPAFLVTIPALAQQPIANAVPFVASNPTSPHTSWSTNPVTLKGTLTSSAYGPPSNHTFTYDWDPGDAGAHCTGTVTNQFVIGCAHTYTGAVGTVFTAVLKITDTNNGLVSPPSNCPPAITAGACYYTSLNAPPPNLPVEVNNAIDNGLWYLHKTMRHFTTTGSAKAGDWTGVGGNVDTNGAGGTGVNALECGAFENSGFLQNNVPLNPYSNDVQLCLVGVFDQLTSIGISAVAGSGLGTYNPDSNGNGIGVEHNGYPENYQTGMMLDAIVGAGSPNTPIPAGTGLAASVVGITGSGPGGAYTYKDTVQDMVDDYAYCIAPDSGFGDSGGWHYSCQETSGDNSVSQWAAIGIIPARRTPGFNAALPASVNADNKTWLDYSFTANSPTNGYFGYTDSSPIWGPFADTPSGLVQLAMNGLGRGTTSPGGKKLWDSAETYVRDNFGVPQSSGATASIKDYYYGMFSFTKSMILHDNSGTGLGSTPLTTLRSLDDPGTCAAPGVPVTAPGSGSGPCYPAIDWYAAQAPPRGSDPTDGVARTIVGNQLADGSWFGQNYTGAQNYFQTGISITMLNKTVFQPVPVACFTANPTHLASGGLVTLDGGCSVEQNPANTITTYQWDISGTGAGFNVGPGAAQCTIPSSCSQMKATFTLPAGATLPYNFPVRLLVTDSGGLTSTVNGSVVISAPPNPPSANAGGPYNFCPNLSLSGAVIYKPFLLDGSKSLNPDQGKTDGTLGAPPSTITAFDWDYACAGTYNSAHGSQVDATGAFDVPAFFGSTFNVCLRVTTNDLCATAAGQTSHPPACAFPTGPTGTESAVGSAQVSIHNPADEVCTHCIQDLNAHAKASVPGNPANIQLYWTDTNTSAQFKIDHYNIYRSTSATFNPFVQVAGAASSPFLPAVQVSNPAGGLLLFLDNNVVGGTTYYYRVAPATANDTETCQGNTTLQVVLPKGR